MGSGTLCYSSSPSHACQSMARKILPAKVSMHARNSGGTDGCGRCYRRPRTGGNGRCYGRPRTAAAGGGFNRCYRRLRTVCSRPRTAAATDLPAGCSFFRPRNVFFPRPRDWSILFSAAACLFFDLQLFFSPAMRPRKRAQSFFQPLCIILSSLFLGPETYLVANPGSFFEPRDIFFWTSGAFF